MITFFISLAILLIGYFIYSKLIERIAGIDPQRKTPAYTMNDGVDYMPLPWWRIFLIQFLNIAGLGPIFGAVAGAMWGPVAFIWIVLGSVFAGAVHDYFSGMLSIKHKGLSITEIVGIYMGKGTKQFMRLFTVFLMIIVGAVFIMGPAKILADITPDIATMTFWVWVVFAYYLLATMLPIDKVIGRIYPVFGFALVFMAVGLIIALFVKGYHIPELNAANLQNFHVNADDFPIFPMLFITIACGAISGFHATQSPLMARCVTNEKYGRRVFYGAMITEGVVALIWAAISMSFFGGIRELNEVMTANEGNAAFIVNEISNSLLGTLGGLLALLGVVAAPITSGDTAFRSARLIVADFMNFKQGPIKNRLLVSLPLFAIGFLLTQIDFSIIWRYFAWANQTLATVVLWTISIYLLQERKFYWITLIPAVFMTAVIVTYLLLAPEGFSLSKDIAYPVGIIAACASFLSFFVYQKRYVAQPAFVTVKQKNPSK
ncbi:carbon starvation CstA family protein [Sunxiuqinia elliptica]|uniref:Carbon starvation protein CstA n=1 Tax=Sunxiuqinia elliptica TaxID=655355 RepID=A0A1I2HGS3_9BACT|nr:carbon starvation protein A [Sunxiuqinia elliptica]SFF27691.1 Carbon starvation protein CstA [Sunxiuqinia elliptica]